MDKEMFRRILNRTLKQSVRPLGKYIWKFLVKGTDGGEGTLKDEARQG